MKPGRVMTVSRIRSEKGVELIEFALVLPLLLLLCMGIIEFGRAYYTYNILAKAVRDGARFLSAGMVTSTGTIDTTIANQTKSVVVYGTVTNTGSPKLPAFTTAQVSLPAVTVVSAAEQYVTVGVNYPYTPLFPAVMPTLTLSPKVTMLFVGRVSYPTP